MLETPTNAAGPSVSTGPLVASPSPAHALCWHRRLEARVLVCLTLVAAFSLAIALLAAQRIVTSHALDQSQEQLRAAQSVFYRLANQRADFAVDQCRLITELPVFQASVDTGDPATVTDMAREYRERLRAQFCVVTGADGRWLARPGWPASAAPQVLEPGIRTALSGEAWRGYTLLERRLFLVVCEPARFGTSGEVLGTLTAGYLLDGAVARELARMSGCEVTFAYGGHLCSSSLTEPGRSDLKRTLGRGAGFPVRSTVAPELGHLGGAQYVGGTYPLGSRFHADDDGRLILLQSSRPTQSFLDRVKSALCVVLVVACALTLTGGLIISHRITRPLRDMVTVAERVAAGDWDCRAAERGSAEVAVLATAFNDMTADLRYWYRAAQSHARHLAETLDQLRQAHDATLKALSRALDARDNETEGHSLHVTHYASRLADALDVDPEEQAALHWGALLHDIGKIGIPDAILHKPGQLTPAGSAVMRGHCLLGLEIVRGIPYLERAADVIRCHHERYDGRGYPGGLAGTEIPRIARIFAVADTLDAITSDRPYRRASSFAHALPAVRKGVKALLANSLPLEHREAMLLFVSLPGKRAPFSTFTRLHDPSSSLS